VHGSFGIYVFTLRIWDDRYEVHGSLGIWSTLRIFATGGACIHSIAVYTLRRLLYCIGSAWLTWYLEHTSDVCELKVHGQ
jgi:hypothetical protein